MTKHTGVMENQETPRLEKGRHVRYWLRCLRTLLPSMYTSNDSNRMYLAYFILSACDLLDIITTSTQPAERHDWVNWIYHCQHPKGGFRMWPGTDFGERANGENAKWDPANINATYFALASLLILGDDLQRVRRSDTLRWLHKMQRDDGSFGETLVEGKQEGGRDSRLGYCATGIRYILRGATEPGPIDISGHSVPDINIDTYVGCIRHSETFDGGIADAPFHEPQAGYTFCSLGSLAFLSRLEPGNLARARPNYAPSRPPAVIRWLLSLQTDFIDPDVAPATELSFQPPNTEPAKDIVEVPSPKNSPPSSDLHQSPDKSTMWSSSIPDHTLDSTLISSTCSSDGSSPSLASLPAGSTSSGMCGRPCKPADTCYAFWAGASLQLLGQGRDNALHDPAALRSYLLVLTQHPVMGGFSKFPGDKWADLYHSYLGLAALSLASTEQEREVDGVKELDAGMCVSAEVRRRLEGVWNGFEA